LIPTDKTSN
jgi:DNA polymerase delta subunit 1